MGRSSARPSIEPGLDRHARKRCVITDDHLASLNLPAPYLAALLQVGIASELAVVPAGEATKSLAQASRLYDELVRRKADRHTLIVALGGGVVGDLAGFVAATFARGLPLIMVPTTLLAQVDSSVGGKVGINHPAAKNLIGAFYQPAGVWIDTETLRTPARSRAAVRPGRGRQVRHDPAMANSSPAWSATSMPFWVGRARPCGGSSLRAAG